MKFRSMQGVGFGRTVRTKAIRLKCLGGVDRLGLGEVIALTGLKGAPAPVFSESTGGLKAIPFEIPGPGKVTIQIRDARGA